MTHFHNMLTMMYSVHHTSSKCYMLPWLLLVFIVVLPSPIVYIFKCDLMYCVLSIYCTGKFHCPVTFKIFNENTHIVAVGNTGNVYSYEVRVI